jgi:hypothetical protein
MKFYETNRKHIQVLLEEIGSIIKEILLEKIEIFVRFHFQLRIKPFSFISTFSR